jgi:alpha-L-arabinofuranosidase
LIDFYAIGNKAHVYTTRDSKNGRIAIWALNFRNAQSQTLKLSLTGLPHKVSIRRLTLKSIKGATTLTSGNYSGNRPEGARNEVDWVESNMKEADPENLELTLEPATISLVLVER